MPNNQPANNQPGTRQPGSNQPGVGQSSHNAKDDAKNDAKKWRRLPKMSFNSKDLSKRMKKVEGATVKHARRFVVKRWSNFRDVRNHIAIWGLTIGVIIGATGLQFWWHQDGFRTTAHASGGTYAEAVLGPVDTLNPIFAKSKAEEAASELLFSRLLRYDTTGHLNFDLAESMKISDDKKTYTVTLRPDAKWDDGLYVRARDVIFTLNLLKNPATRSTLSGWGEVQVKEIDDLTVSFTLPAVYAAFPHALRTLPILPEHALRDVEPALLRENNFSKKPVGSGAFTLRLLQEVDAANGRKVVHLARNNDYYRGKAKLDRIQLHVYKDADAIKKALATSEVNAASDLPVLTAAEVSASRYIVENQPVHSGVYALFNTSTGVLQDKKVRQALQTGTDTQAIRAGISKNLPDLHLPFINGQLRGAVPAPPVHDVQRAGALLDEAGWRLDGMVRKKDGQPLTISAVTTKNPDYEKALNSLAEQWRALGVTVTTNIANPDDPEQHVAQDVLQPRKFDVLLYELAIGADPDVYAYWHGSQATAAGYNFSNYKSAIGDDALISARSRLDPDLRNAKYLTFAKQWLDDAPAIGIYQVTAQYVHTPSVNGPTGSVVLIANPDRYGTVRDWTVGFRNVFKTP